MSTQDLEIRRSSASVLGSLSGIRSVTTVSKYIDTTTCIGCKACEVGVQEWNDLRRSSHPADRARTRRCRPFTPSTGT